jgi:hypothetical protein
VRRMKRGTVLVALLAMIVVVAVLVMIGASTGFGLGASAKASTLTSTVSAAKPLKYVVFDCNSGPEVKPADYIATCADDGEGLQSMHWTSWTPRLASGYGTMYENDCIPYCAAGHIHYYQAIVVFWGSALVKGHPAERSYTRLTLIFTAKRPPIYNLKNGKLVATYPPTQTWSAVPE